MKPRVTATWLGVVLLLLAGTVLAGGSPTVDWAVMGSGEPGDAAPFSLAGTVGQAVVGIQGPATLELCSGFWCGVGVAQQTYLPLIVRNH